MWRICLTSFIIWLMINSSFVLSASISPDTYHNGHGYKIFNDGMTWQQAKSYCERLDGHLVTITSVMEQVFIEDLIRKNGAKNNYWLGGCRSGNIWSWVTGENFLYTHWASYQPDNFLENEDALMIYNGVNPMNPVNRIGEWNDVKSDGNCNNEPFFGTSNFGFICEWDTMVDVDRGSTNIIDGIYSIQPQCAPDKELSVENNSTSWGANVIIDNINSNWKKWKVQRIANTDYYSIIAVHSNLALDVANARAENGVNISTWPYLGGSQNQFKILYAGNGYYTIQANIGGNFVVDVFNRESNAGTNVWSYGFNGTPAQLWKLVLIEKLPVFQSYSKKATQKVTAYVMPDLQAKSGDEYVSAGDNVTVLREEGDSIFVSYPVRGGTKERWVNKDDIFGGNVNMNGTPVNNSSSSFDPIWPLANSHTITTLYQYSKGGRHSSRYRCAIDMAAPEGENVLATESGTVIASFYDTKTGFGNVIKIKHDNDKVSLYAHLSARLVSNGRVSKGQVIGRVGHTSAKYKYPDQIGNHLHFELGNSDNNGADGDPWKEYFKSKYGNIVTLAQAASKDPNR